MRIGDRDRERESEKGVKEAVSSLIDRLCLSSFTNIN